MTRISLFDLDNTLLHGDSDHAFGGFLHQLGYMTPAELQQQHQFFADYNTGDLDMNDYTQFLAGIIRRIPVSKRPSVQQEFSSHIQKNLLSHHAHDVLNHFQQYSQLLMLITATHDFIAKPIAQQLGFEHTIATEWAYQHDNGGDPFLGYLHNEPSFQEGKVTRLNAWLQQQGMALNDFEQSYFFSDSHNDLPLLKKVTHPVAVDPDDILREYAVQHQWPIVSFRDPHHHPLTQLLPHQKP